MSIFIPYMSQFGRQLGSTPKWTGLAGSILSYIHWHLIIDSMGQCIIQPFVNTLLILV